MVPMTFPSIRTPASCHTPLPAWLQSPLLALSGLLSELASRPL
jgi:hypothetical protein